MPDLAGAFLRTQQVHTDTPPARASSRMGACRSRRAPPSHHIARLLEVEMRRIRATCTCPNGARTSEAHDSLGILQVRRGMSAAVVAVPPERRRVSAQRLRPLAVPTEQRRDRLWHGTGGRRITEAISATAAALGTPGAHCIASFTNSLAGRSRADCDEIGETAGSGTLVRTGLRRLPR